MRNGERSSTRDIDDNKFSLIEPIIERFFTHKVWVDPDPEIDGNLRVVNVEHVKQFLNTRGLNPAWLLNLE